MTRIADSGQFIGGQWVPGAGERLTASDPATGQAVWCGAAASRDQVQRAVAAARAAQPGWAAKALDERVVILQRFADQVDQRREALARTICRQTGKPWWESLTEVAAMAGKASLAIQAHAERCRPTEHDLAGTRGRTSFRPHGVLAVFGPFNLPGHLPGSHILPALLAGNSIVFKPSERVPAVGQAIAACWEAAGLPAGVLNLVQGGQDVGHALAGDPGIDGLLFTGGCRAGLAIRRAWSEQPQKILALEMGGNNPLVVDAVANAEAAAYLTIQSAFITAGQRCTCARRLIVPPGAANEHFITTLVTMLAGVKVGPWTQRPEPFMGPVISREVADQLLAAQADWLKRGGVPRVTMTRLGDHPTLLSPGLIDVTAVQDRQDEEYFGPLLQLIRVPDFQAAVTEANRTRYGLAAALFSDRPDRWERFELQSRAGVVNWNRQTTQASGAMPFGGIGFSGNHRPSGYFAADTCAYPVASLMRDRLTMPEDQVPGVERS